MIENEISLHLPFWRRVLLWPYGETSRKKRYSILLLLVFTLIWGPSFLFLIFATPVYTSEWTLILPGSGLNSTVDLENIGKATANSVSAFSSHYINPNANYKTIAESNNVLEQAANAMNMAVTSFGKPRITLVDQTSMLFFQVKGNSAEEAQKKSFALYAALEQTLNHLRLDEQQNREVSIQSMLENFKDKLKHSRMRLLEYQSESGLVGMEQFKQLMMSLEQVKIDLVALKAEQSRLMGERDQLVKILNLNADQASDALVMQTDPVFQENMTHYAQSDALLAKQILKMGENHPDVIKARNEWKAAKQKLAGRIKQLVGKTNTALLNQLTLSPDKTRGELFEKLIFLDTETKGITQKILKLEQQLGKMKDRMRKDTRSAAYLDDLQRDHQIAEAVFTSALARIDIGKSDIYASYPLVQVLSPPSLPEKPTSPNPLYVFIGAGIASFISLFGMFTLWMRNR